MNWFTKWFKTQSKVEEPEEILSIARTIDPTLNKIADDVFRAYQEQFLKKPITYIVPAVWGADKDGPLDTIQKQIHQQVSPMVEQVFTVLNLKHLSPAQEFAILFLIRGLVVSKITYMIEVRKSQNLSSIHQKKHPLYDLEPIGRA